LPDTGRAVQLSMAACVPGLLIAVLASRTIPRPGMRRPPAVPFPPPPPVTPDQAR
jgi:hypothetical protein